MALKKCPYCAEEIQEEAMLCKHCKSNLSVAPQVVPEPTPVSPPAQPQVQPIPTPTPVAAVPVNSDDRRNPEFVMGLIGGILGFGGGFFALMFGGIGAAFGASGADTIGSLGVSAFFFSILGIVGSVIVRKHGKLGGLFMTAAALGGLISISLFFLLPFILLGIAGIMGLVKKNQAEISTKYILWIPITVAIFALSFVIGFASKPTAGIGKDKIDTSKVNKMGTDVKIGDLEYNVSGARWVNGIKGEYSSYTGTFLIVDVAVSNLGKEAITVDSSMLTLLDSTDAKYEASMEATRAIKSNADFFLTSLNPRTKLVGSVAFNIPKQEKMPRLKVTGGMFSSDAKLIELDTPEAASIPKTLPPAPQPNSSGEMTNEEKIREAQTRMPANNNSASGNTIGAHDDKYQDEKDERAKSKKFLEKYFKCNFTDTPEKDLTINGERYLAFTAWDASKFATKDGSMLMYDIAGSEGPPFVNMGTMSKPNMVVNELDGGD